MTRLHPPLRAALWPSAPAAARPTPRRPASLDDAGRLRRCRACDCSDLYLRRRGVEAMTGWTAAAGLLAAAAGGLLTVPQALVGLLAVAGTALAAAWLRGPMPGDAGPVLCCYRCDARFAGIAPTPRQRRWSAETAALYANAPAPAPSTAPAIRLVIADDLVVPPPHGAADRVRKAAKTATVRGTRDAATPHRKAA